MLSGSEASLPGLKLLAARDASLPLSMTCLRQFVIARGAWKRIKGAIKINARAQAS